MGERTTIEQAINLLLAVCLLSGLTACGKEQPDGQDGRIVCSLPQAVDFTSVLSAIGGRCLTDGAALYVNESR